MKARSTATHNPINRVLERLSGVEKSGVGWKACCPVPGHGQKGGDRNPSMHVSEGDDRRVLLKCRVGCSTDDVLDAAGLTCFCGPSVAGVASLRRCGASKTRRLLMSASMGLPTSAFSGNFRVLAVRV
jgi:hypothetical protein